MPDLAPTAAPPFHFVFGLKPQTEPFHLMHYLCLQSCRRLHPLSVLHLHYRHLPHGPWWDKIAPYLTLHQVEGQTPGYAPERYQHSSEGRLIEQAGLSYAHESDFIRLQALLEHGGIYADMDTLFVRPYPDALFQHDCVLGEESTYPDTDTGIHRPSLCNAVIMARARAPFVAQWLDMAKENFDGTWSRHSCQAAGALWSRSPGQVHVLPWWWFYGFPATKVGLQALFESQAPVPDGLCSIHLWAHLWWSSDRVDFSAFHHGLLNESYVRQVDTTYARLARPFLDDSATCSSD